MCDELFIYCSLFFKKMKGEYIMQNPDYLLAAYWLAAFVIFMLPMAIFEK